MPRAPFKRALLLLSLLLSSRTAGTVYRHYSFRDRRILRKNPRARFNDFGPVTRRAVRRVYNVRYNPSGYVYASGVSCRL